MANNLTAVEWLEKKLIEAGLLFEVGEAIEVQQAKEMQKQEITKAFDAGFKDNSHYQNPNYRDSEQYYNETFNK